MRNVQIPYSLFCSLVRYHLADCYDREDEIKKGLELKLETLVQHELYEKYKTLQDPKEREEARQKYLDSKGIPGDFRW